MGKILKIIAGIFILLIVALVVFIATFDINQYKDDVVKLVEEKTGRDFEIAGDFELGVSLIPKIKVEGVKLGNAAWGSAPEMISAKSFEAEIGLIPLLSGDLKISQLVLNNSVILLETNQQGKGNWEFEEVKPVKKEKKKEVKEGAAPPVVNVNEVNIKNASLTYKDGVTGKVTNLEIDEFIVETAAFSQSMDVLLRAVYNEIPVSIDGSLGSLGNLTKNRDVPVDALVTIADATLKLNGKVEKPLDLKGLDLDLDLTTESLAPFEKIIEKELPKIGPLHINGHVNEKDGFYHLTSVNVGMLQSKMIIDGMLSTDNPSRDFDLNIKFKTGSLSNFNALAEKQLPDTGELVMAGQISEKDGIYNLKSVNANMGKTRLTIDGKLTDLTKTEGSDLDIKFSTETMADLNSLLNAEYPALGPVTLIAKVTDKEGVYHLNNMKFNADKTDLAGSFSIDLKGERPVVAANLNSNLVDLKPFMGEKQQVKAEKKTRVFSPDPLPLEGLKSIDIDLDIKAKKITTADLDLDNVKLSLSLSDGKLSLKPLNAIVAGGSLVTNLKLNASNPKSAAMDTQVNIKNFQPSTLPDLKDKLTGGKTDIDINVKGTGNSIAALMAGLNGKFLLKMGQGTLKSDKGDKVTSDLFLSTFNAIYSDTDTSSTTEINCGVVNLDIKDGIATADKTIAFDTKKMNIVGSGIINLKTEELDIGIDPQAKEEVGISVGQLAELVRIGGTIAEPKAVPDTVATFKTAASDRPLGITSSQKTESQKTESQNGTTTPESDKKESGGIGDVLKGLFD